MAAHGQHLATTAGAALLLYAARRYFRNWSTTKDECRMPLPGDELIRQPVSQTTEAVWIERSAGEVWPWLVQMGQDRGGLYGYELVENLFGLKHRNADRIHPEWQRLQPGDSVRLTPQGWLGRREGIKLWVAQVIDEQAIVLRAEPPDLPWEAVWSFHLMPYSGERCRLLVRTRVALRHPGEVVLAELASPVTALMTRGMLRGIRRRVHNAGVATERPAVRRMP
jgi:hypothetical protein